MCDLHQSFCHDFRFHACVLEEIGQSSSSSVDEFIRHPTDIVMDVFDGKMVFRKPITETEEV